MRSTEGLDGRRCAANWGRRGEKGDVGVGEGANHCNSQWQGGLRAPSASRRAECQFRGVHWWLLSLPGIAASPRNWWTQLASHTCTGGGRAPGAGGGTAGGMAKHGSRLMGTWLGWKLRNYDWGIEPTPGRNLLGRSPPSILAGPAGARPFRPRNQ